LMRKLNRTDSHGGTIAPTMVRLAFVSLCPLVK
jgi:hypothetical protein